MPNIVPRKPIPNGIHNGHKTHNQLHAITEVSLQIIKIKANTNIKTKNNRPALFCVS